MIRPLTICVLVLLSYAVTPGAAEAADGCHDPFRLAQRSFAQLPDPANYAVVWTDNISPRLLGGFRPFEIYVLVGSVFRPLQGQGGRLEREDFLNLRLNPDTTRQPPLKVTMDLPTAERTLTFSTNNRVFTLRVVDVNAVFFREDFVILKLCWQDVPRRTEPR